MRSYNYLANELPRELIEVYNDIEQDLLRIYVRELKKGTEPAQVFAKMQDKIKTYDQKTQDVLAIIMEDRNKKDVAQGIKDFKEEPTESQAVSKGEANALITPLLVAGIGILTALNTQIVNNAMNDYTSDYLGVQASERRGGFGAVSDFLQSAYRNLASKGITIRQALGRQTRDYSIENVIRRDVMYKVNQASSKVNMQNFKKSSAKFVEVSSHPTARTWNKYMKNAYEDHSSWQGKCYYSRDGEYVEGYQEFESTCGYGEMLGIGGINCYHQFEMNYTGEPIATQYEDKEVQKQYELSQQQRKYERAIRKLKSARAVFEEAGDERLAKSIGQNIKVATARLKTFCDDNNLKYYNWRTQI